MQLFSSLSAQLLLLLLLFLCCCCVVVVVFVVVVVTNRVGKFEQRLNLLHRRDTAERLPLLKPRVRHRIALRTSPVAGKFAPFFLAFPFYSAQTHFVHAVPLLQLELRVLSVHSLQFKMISAAGAPCSLS